MILSWFNLIKINREFYDLTTEEQTLCIFHELGHIFLLPRYATTLIITKRQRQLMEVQAQAFAHSKMRELGFSDKKILSLENSVRLRCKYGVDTNNYRKLMRMVNN